MFRFAMTQMRSSLGRLAAAAIAIMLGTAFIASSLMGTDVIIATAESAVLAETNSADVIDDGVPTVEAAKAIAALPEVRGVDVKHQLPLNLSAGGASRYVQLDDLPQWGAQPPLATGWLPSAAGDVAVSERMASSLDLAVGDTVSWHLSGTDHLGTLLITGITKDSLMTGAAPLWASSETFSQIERLAASTDVVHDSPTLLVYGDQNVPPDEVSTAIRALDGGHDPMTSDEYTDMRLEQFIGDANFLTNFALAFAAVAMIVAGMVITNTFEVLVAQRAHTLALMRCAGATKPQIRRSVLLEALVLGAVASIAGVALGVGLVQIAVAFLRGRVFGLEVPGVFDLSPAVFIAPIVVGTIMTVLAAFGPARVATRVSPVAALRPQAAPNIRKGSRSRLWLGLASFIVGSALLIGPALFVLSLNSRAENSSAAMGAIGPLLLIGILGGLLTVAGVLILSVFVVPTVVRMLGAVLAAVLPKEAAATTRLATANAIRNPRRTAATTSALVIGIGLVVMMSTGAATARTTLHNSTQMLYPGDVYVSSYQGRESDALSDEAIAILERTDGVQHAAPVWTAPMWMESGSDMQESVAITDIAKLNAVMPGPDLPTDFEGVIMDEHQAATIRESEHVIVESATTGERKELPVKFIEEDSWLGALVSKETAAQIMDVPNPDSYVLDIDDDRAADVINALQSELGEVAPDVVVQAVAEERQMLDQVINALLAALIGLLGVAVIIALVGVANTLSLSVIERRREHGMLRAVGVTQPQLRHMLTVEGILIALAGIGVGIVLGIVTGLAGSTILLGVAPEFTPALDWRVILGCIAVGIIAGTLASVLPARSATKVPVVVALTS